MKGIFNKRLILPVALIAAFIVAGYGRDFIFVNINHQLSYLYFHDDYNWVSKHLSFIKSFTYMQLYWSKWVLTGFFVLLYAVITLLTIHHLFRNKLYFKITCVSFLIFILLAVSFYVGGILLNHVAEGYKFARKFMGVVQSPIIAMILIPAFLFAKHSEQIPGSSS